MPNVLLENWLNVRWTVTFLGVFSWHNGQIIQYTSVDVSIAVALEEGLLPPIIKNANEKGIIEISKEIKNLINQAKDGKLIPDDYNGGTISISNLGMYGINEFAAIINPLRCWDMNSKIYFIC